MNKANTGSESDSCRWERNIRFLEWLPNRLLKRIAIVFFVIASAVIFYFVVNVIEGCCGFGFRLQFDIPKVDYSGRNRIFDQYTPMITLNVNIEGREKVITASQVTVGEVISDMGIVVDENDRVNYPLDSVVSENMTIVYERVDENTITVTKVLPHETEFNYIQTIPKGTKKVTSSGSDGLAVATLYQTYVNGKLESETVLSETIVNQPVTEKVDMGVGGTIRGADGRYYDFLYYMDVEATAYGGEEFSGLTYTGVQVEIGMIAVDPEVIKLGTVCYVREVEGRAKYDFGVCTATDTGSMIIGKIIDIYMGDDLEAMKLFGRRPMRVYIMSEPDDEID